MSNLVGAIHAAECSCLQTYPECILIQKTNLGQPTHIPELGSPTISGTAAQCRELSVVAILYKVPDDRAHIVNVLTPPSSHHHSEYISDISQILWAYSITHKLLPVHGDVR
jgi:hypothetical protein